jgi:hypothetical protein
LPEPKVKGVTLRSAMQALERLRGAAVVQATTDALHGEAAEGFRYGTIIAAGWYPTSWYRELHAAMLRVTGEGEQLIRDVEREAARADMTGVYSLAFKLLSPQVLLSLSSRLFSTYYDTGKVQMLDARKGYARSRWSGCTGFNRSIWVGVFASCELFLELAGAKNVRPHVVAGGGAHDDFAELEAYWT